MNKRIPLWALLVPAVGIGEDGGPTCTMLTLETELAVEAGCRVVGGLEYSFFSYFPELPTPEARRRGVVNRELLRESVASAPPELIALAEHHPQRLLGPERDPRTGAVKPPEPGSIRPLAFLGPLADRYEPLRSVWIPTSVRAPGTSGLARVLVYRLKRATATELAR